MFEELFHRKFAISRHRNGPMLEERLRFLRYQASQDMARDTLRASARYLLAVCETLNLPARSGESIRPDEIDEVAILWAGVRMDADRRFRAHATQFLRFLGRLHEPDVVPPPYSHFIGAFSEYLRRERGLSPWTIDQQCWTVGDFLSRLYAAKTALSEITVSAVDSLLMAKITEAGYARVSVRTYANSLRSFFRYAEMRGWCQSGVAEAIKAARIFPQERLPAGPSWENVQRVLATTEDEHPTNIRDRAILLLLAIYGLRSREVVDLRLDDFNWEQEVLLVRRSKSREVQTYPLTRTVGDAVLRYIENVRPNSPHRELFLTRGAPYRPLHSGLWRIVASRLRPLGLSLMHHGPHALRHACATYLLAQGFSMKEIGDHLGHHDPEATRIYAKVDLVGLRRVAEFDLGDLP